MNHALQPISMWRKFFDWVDGSPRHCFKRCYHEDLAKEFDSSSKVWFEQHGNDSFYDNYTCITFSDNSYVMFNYKGEVEASDEEPTTPRSSSPSSHFSVHNHTGDQS